MAINATQLANEIQNQLRLYEQSVKEEINLSAQEVGKELVKDLKQVRKFKKKSKNYYKGWTLKKKGAGIYVVYNKTSYQLTHLLEKGHALRNGGRAQAFPHIAPLEEKAVADFLERVERAIRP